MAIKRLIAKQVLSDAECDALAAEFLDESHYLTVLEDEADVYRPDGTALLHFRKNQIPESQAVTALKALYYAATEYGNRGLAAGKVKHHIAGGKSIAGKITQNRHVVDADGDDVRFKYRKLDGTVSKTNIALTVPSGIVGAFDRQPRFPYCRLSKFTAENPHLVKKALPFIQTVSEVFKRNSPDRYKAQLTQCARTHPDYVFKGTAFTTITVNRNWRTATHKDAGDLRSGFGVLSVLSEGRYSGGYFIIPKYGIAVDMQHRDVLLADVHEWHGNSPLEGVSRYWTRLSTVFYFRSKIVGCKSLLDELEIAKRRVEGMPMYPDFEGDFPE